MLFKNKQRELEAELAAYREEAARCVDEFQRSFRQYCQSSDLDELNKNVVRIHRAESRADDIRREIEVAMYSKALFPESRGDVLGLLETMDRVPNQAESVVRLIVNQFITIPAWLHGDLFRLVDVSVRCVEAMLAAAAKVFTDFADATAMLGNIDELESQADGIEANLTRQVFASDIRDLDKMLLRDLIRAIADISDRAENVGDRIRIIVVKRMV